MRITPAEAGLLLMSASAFSYSSSYHYLIFTIVGLLFIFVLFQLVQPDFCLKTLVGTYVFHEGQTIMWSLKVTV